MGAVYPKKIATMVAIYEIFIGSGFFTGPQIGAIFIGISYSFLYIMFRMKQRKTLFTLFSDLHNHEWYRLLLSLRL